MFCLYIQREIHTSPHPKQGMGWTTRLRYEKKIYPPPALRATSSEGGQNYATPSSQAVHPSNEGIRSVYKTQSSSALSGHLPQGRTGTIHPPPSGTPSKGRQKLKGQDTPPRPVKLSTLQEGNLKSPRMNGGS